MGLTQQLIEWWNRKMVRWGCKHYGHNGVVTIETYSTQVTIKNWVFVGKKIFFVPPFKEFKITGKHRCTTCGTVFLGVIVKEELFTNNRYDA
jgi:hypothetical protein